MAVSGLLSVLDYHETVETALVDPDGAASDDARGQPFSTEAADL